MISCRSWRDCLRVCNRGQTRSTYYPAEVTTVGFAAGLASVVQRLATLKCPATLTKPGVASPSDDQPHDIGRQNPGTVRSQFRLMSDRGTMLDRTRARLHRPPTQRVACVDKFIAPGVVHGVSDKGASCRGHCKLESPACLVSVPIF